MLRTASVGVSCWPTTTFAKPVSKSSESLPPSCREAAQDQDCLADDGVDDRADRLVVEQEMHELRDLDVVGGDVGFARRSDDQVLLLGPVQVQPPSGDPIDATAREGGVRKVCPD